MNKRPYWHNNQFEQLTKQYKNGQLPHAVLFVGYTGDGIQHFLKDFCQLLLCLNPGQSACGHCKSCQLSLSGHHPDFLHIQPEGKSLTIKVDAVRSINHQIEETAQQGGNKVVYVESAHKMNTNSANALLKVLEEPTDNTFILLETAELSRTLPTIRSRCRIEQLSKPTIDQSRTFLSTNNYSEDIDISLGIAKGRPMDALNIDAARIQSFYEREDKFLNNQNFTQLSQFIAKSDIEDLLEQLLMWTDSVLRLSQSTKIGLAPVSEGLLKSLINIEKSLVFRFRDFLIEKIGAMKRQSNLNSQLMAEELAARWLALRGLK